MQDHVVNLSADLPHRVPLLLDAIESDLTDLAEDGLMQGAVALRQATGQHFNATHRPQYFTGDLSARFVLVHLNPKQSDDLDDRYVDRLPFTTVDEYLSWYSDFGARHYGTASTRTHRSPFDAKQVRFIRPFGDIEFVDEATTEDRYTNLERVIDNKLQLEVIPYGSDNFRTAPFRRHPGLLRPHLDRLLQVITAWPRSHVIFCGSVFDDMLGEFRTGPTQEFQLMKNDGRPTRGAYRFAPLELRFSGTAMPAGIAHTFAQQGLPAMQYGQEIARRYRQMVE